MIKTLIINGSPKGERSNTAKLTEAFCNGLKSQGNYNIKTLTINKAKINHCTGCFGCWTKTPGQCVINDDMGGWLDTYIESDLVIWSLPLYYFGMPSKIKAFMDRLLPLNQPIINKEDDGRSFHPARYDLSEQKHVLISTCGFFSKVSNYDALIKQFEIFTLGQTNELASILCPEGELFSQMGLKGRCDAYLEQVQKAGIDYDRKGKISVETQAELDELLYPPEVFMEMANAHWDIADVNDSISKDDTEKNKIEKFMRMMASSYNSSTYKKDIILELAFTDRNLSFQLFLGQDKCILECEENQKVTTRIETTFQVWKDISDGKILGPQAMMDGLYKVRGDFDTMNHLGDFFGTAAKKESSQIEKAGKAFMISLLIPWISLWVFLPIEPLAQLGGGISIGLCAMITLLGFFTKLTPYDRLSTSLVTLFGLVALMGMTSPLLISLSYFTFGVMWFISSWSNIPLTAHYSCYSYGGTSAFNNPLFIKTNRILTMNWGILYIIISLISWFLLKSSLRSYTGMITQSGTIFMGIFTIWFQRWYPAKIARG